MEACSPRSSSASSQASCRSSSFPGCRAVSSSSLPLPWPCSSCWPPCACMVRGSWRGSWPDAPACCSASVCPACRGIACTTPCGCLTPVCTARSRSRGRSRGSPGTRPTTGAFCCARNGSSRKPAARPRARFAWAGDMETGHPCPNSVRANAGASRCDCARSATSTAPAPSMWRRCVWSRGYATGAVSATARSWPRLQQGSMACGRVWRVSSEIRPSTREPPPSCRPSSPATARDWMPGPGRPCGARARCI